MPKPASRASSAKSREAEPTRIAVVARPILEGTGQQPSGIRGVVSSPSGQAVSGSSVCVWPSEPNFEFWKQSFCTNTDRLGAFEIAVEPGAWLLAVRGGVGLRDLTQVTQVIAGKFVPLRLVLSPGGATLSGKVLDASGGPISKATIAAYPPGVGERPGEPALALALSDADGAFSLSASEGELELRVAADGYATALLSTSAPKTSFEVALLPGSSVSGVVVGAAQQPVVGVLVQARSERPLGGIAQAVSGSDGSFSIHGVSEGMAYVRIVSEAWFAEPLRFEVEPSSEQTGVRIVASRAVTVRGTILVNNEPCAAHGQVLLSGAATFGAEAQAGGVVKLPGVPPATYQVRVQCDTASDLVGALDLTEETPALIWRLSRGLSVRVSVLADEGEPARQLQVHALGVQSAGAAQENAGPSHSVECAPTGAAMFECRGLSPGAHSFSVSTDGRVLAQVEAVLDVGNNPEMALRLPETGAVHVRLRGGDASGTNVVANGAVSASAVAAPDGSFWIRFLKPGSYTVRTQDFAAEAQVNVAHNATTEVLLTLPAVQELSGVVLDGEGQPVSDATVLLRREGLLAAVALRQRRTDLDGRFSFGDLQSAQYSVAVESSAGAGEFLVRTARPAVLRVPSAPLLPDWFSQQ